jgi:4-hydroxy-2-oxoheptanedioate aldolase
MAGFDWALVDLEHGAGDESQMLAQLQGLASTNAAGLVRVESNDRVRVTKALDAGALGVMMPRVETAASARAAVAHAHYPPRGDRGVALVHRGSQFGLRSIEDMATNSPLVIAQIETVGTLEQLRDTADVDGIDVLFVGPADLTWSLGIPGRLDHSSYLRAIDAIANEAQRTGKAAGVQLSLPEQASDYVARGYSFLGLSGESALLAKAARDILFQVTTPREESS